MSLSLIILLCVDAALLLGLGVYVIVAIAKGNANKQESVNTEETQEECCCCTNEECDCDKQEQVEACSEECSEKDECSEEDEDGEEIDEQSKDDDQGSDAESKVRPTFASKMLALDDKAKGYYNAIDNELKSMRKINPRVSLKGVSYRLGRELVAKLTVRGKTIKLHLALDVNKYEQKTYFQKDMSDVKAYAQVPFTVKVKSDRGLKNAMKLIGELASEKGIEKKKRYNAVDSVGNLK